MFNRQSVLVATFVVIGAVVALRVTTAIANDPGEQAELMQPVVTWSGDHSAIGTAAFMTITGNAQWREFWLAHRGERIVRNHLEEPEVPQIDFDRMIAVVIIAELQDQCRGVHIEDVSRVDGSLRVRFAEPQYATASMAGEVVEPAPPTRPFAVAVVPRTESPIVFEAGRFSKRTNTYVQWERVASIE
jgi:hypothetical protein